MSITQDISFIPLTLAIVIKDQDNAEFGVTMDTSTGQVELHSSILEFMAGTNSDSIVGTYLHVPNYPQYTFNMVFDGKNAMVEKNDVAEIIKIDHASQTNIGMFQYKLEQSLKEQSTEEFLRNISGVYANYAKALIRDKIAKFEAESDGDTEQYIIDELMDTQLKNESGPSQFMDLNIIRAWKHALSLYRAPRNEVAEEFHQYTEAPVSLNVDIEVNDLAKDFIVEDNAHTEIVDLNMSTSFDKPQPLFGNSTLKTTRFLTPDLA